jgi:microcystin-dependent protein
MSTKFNRPAAAYAGAVGLSNRTKYQDDAVAVPKRAISSSKIDGDLNYVVDGLNETWDALSAASFATALPNQTGNAGRVPVTNGAITSWQLVGNSNVADGSLQVAKMAPVGANKLLGSSAGGAVQALEMGDGFTLAGSVLRASLPPGMVVPFAANMAPSGWLLCSGAAVSRATFADLFAVIGTTFGAGDGTTTFNLPDLRGRLLVGKDDMGGTAASRVTSGGSGVSGTVLGAVGGNQLLQQHTHTATVNDPGHAHNAAAGQFVLANAGGTDTAGGAGFITAGTRVAATASATTGVTVTLANTGTGSSQNMPPVMVLNWLIKA